LFEGNFREAEILTELFSNKYVKFEARSIMSESVKIHEK